MKKEMLIIILSAMLTACGNTPEETKAETSAVSRTAKAAVTASETITTTKITATKSVSTVETTSTSETTSTTRKETTTEKSTTTTKAVTKSTNTKQNQQTVIQTHINNEVISTTSAAQPEVTLTETKPVTTTVQTTTSAATTSPTTTAAPPSETSDETSGADWSDSMKVWRKLCEGQQLSDGEMEHIRNEIIDYAVSSFGGRTDIHVSFGSDSHDIVYEKPLNLIVCYELTEMKYAHYDAFANPDRVWLIENAADEQEIYEIVSETRGGCLHIIDKGLFNRWEIFGMNGMLKYASDIEFNIGFDEDLTIWFLTKD